MTTTSTTLSQTEQSFLEEVKRTFAQANLEFARSYYLFATARLEKTYNSAEIYEKYPLLQAEETFKRLKPLYDQNPTDEEIKRLFVDALGTYIGNIFCKESDELTNLKNTLEIDVTGLGLIDQAGNPVEKLLYEDTFEWFKRIPEKATREALYQKVANAYTEYVTPRFIELFLKENQLLADLGYSDIVGFYSQSSGHDLKKLGQKARQLIQDTESVYVPKISEYYRQRTGLDFVQATRADISYVFNGKSQEMAAIDAKFPESQLIELARQTFDGMGLDFSQIAQSVDFQSKADYLSTVEDEKRSARILLDVTKREGKRSRAYVYPAQVPNEVYLSVKPEGGLDDFSAFFHESGHAQHFAYVREDLSYPLALMGNNTVTESYAYLFQNLFLNKHWLTQMAGLLDADARKAIRRSALNDLYMLRRYASKMQFELQLYEGTSLAGKPELYAGLLTEGTGFQYDAEGWSRDVDAGFYVADYFTAWALEAQLREYLMTHFGSAEHEKENWYQNPQAGQFLKNLWKDGNLTQADLSNRLQYNDPTDVGPLLRLMKMNLDR